MIRRIILVLCSFTVVMGALTVGATSQESATVDKLQSILQDEEQLSHLLTEMWVLRDTLALQQGGDTSAQVTDFQRLQEQLLAKKASLIEYLRTSRPQVEPAENIQTATLTLADNLDRFGISRNSELSKRLVTAYIVFSEILELASIPPVCTLHPFRGLC